MCFMTFKSAFTIYAILMLLPHLGWAETAAPVEAPKPAETQEKNNDTSLTIYKDAALVKRKILLALEAGSHLYKVDGVAETIHTPSLMLELQSDSKSGQIQEYSVKPDNNLEEASGGSEKFLEITIATKQPDAHNHLAFFYLFRNLGWRVDYTLELAPAYESLALSAWIEIINQSGVDFNKANIHLIESDVPSSVKEDSSVTAKPTVYSLPNPVSLRKNSAKKINWASTRGIQVQRQYRLYVGGKYLQDLHNKTAQPLIETWITFSNSQKQGLGLPLPAGQAAFYSQGPNNNLVLLGMIDIPSAAVDQDISLKIPSEGVSAASTIETALEQHEFKKLTDQAAEANYRLCLKNKGNKPVTIKVILDLPVTNCKIIKENKAHTIDSLKQYSWTVEIPPESEVDLKYRLQVDLG